jgi:hypothetical protein
VTTEPTSKGAPTRAQAQAVWQALKQRHAQTGKKQDKPSTRNVAKELAAEGYSITYGAIGKWQRANWQETAGLVRTNQRHPNRKTVAQAVRNELEKQDPVTLAEATKMATAGIEQAIIGTKLTEVDLARIEKAVADLKTKTIADLREEQERERLIYNIILLRESQRQANIQALIPKDTSELVGKFTDDARASLSPAMPIMPTAAPGEQAQLPAPIVNGEFKVVSPTKAAIERYLAKENA